MDEIGEGLARCKLIDAAGIALFGKMGVDADVLQRTWRGYHERIWSARVVMFDRARGFEFAEEKDERGRKAWIMLVLDSMMDPLDLVAWRPNEGRVESWRNRATLMGEDNLGAPRLRASGALPIWRSPVGWLRAQRYGLVPVVKRYVARRLLGHDPFEAEDAEHARELRKLLTMPVPKVCVAQGYERSSESAAAAMALARPLEEEGGHAL